MIQFKIVRVLADGNWQEPPTPRPYWVNPDAVISAQPYGDDPETSKETLMIVGNQVVVVKGAAATNVARLRRTK